MTINSFAKCRHVIPRNPQRPHLMILVLQKIYTSAIAENQLTKTLDQYYERIYVLGDLHGDLEATLSLLKAAELILWSPFMREVETVALFLRENQDFTDTIVWTGKDSVLVQLGDIVDRGPDGYLLYKLFQFLGDCARDENGNVLHILGNHEILNMIGKSFYVNPLEIQRYYSNNIGEWRREWAPNGSLGRWIREHFLVYCKLNNRFLFVHGGLTPYFARVSNAQLKRDLLESIDRNTKETALISSVGQALNSTQLSDTTRRNTSKFSNGNTTLWQSNLVPAVLYSDGPFWLKRFSLMNEREVCPEIQESLFTSFNPLMNNKSLMNKHEIYESLDFCDPKFMIVGHTVTKSGNVEIRCQHLHFPVNFKSSNCCFPAGYIMVDTGISRFVRGTGQILFIHETKDHLTFDQISSNRKKKRLLTVPLQQQCKNQKNQRHSNMNDPVNSEL